MIIIIIIILIITHTCNTLKHTFSIALQHTRIYLQHIEVRYPIITTTVIIIIITITQASRT